MIVFLDHPVPWAVVNQLIGIATQLQKSECQNLNTRELGFDLDFVSSSYRGAGGIKEFFFGAVLSKMAPCRLQRRPQCIILGNSGVFWESKITCVKIG